MRHEDSFPCVEGQRRTGYERGITTGSLPSTLFLLMPTWANQMVTLILINIQGAEWSKIAIPKSQTDHEPVTGMVTADFPQGAGDALSQREPLQWERHACRGE